MGSLSAYVATWAAATALAARPDDPGSWHEAAHAFGCSRESQCGIAAVYAILAKYNRPAELDAISAGIGQSVHGANMADMVRFLRSRGRSARPVPGSLRALRKYFGSSRDTSAILHFGNHWVAALGCNADSFVVLEYPRKITTVRL